MNETLICNFRDQSGNTAQGTSLTTVNDGLWHFVQWIRSDQNFYLYIDGKLNQLSNNPTIGNVNTDNGVPPRIGMRASPGTFYPYEGLIDDIAIWKAALSASELKLIYNRQKQKYAGHYDSPVINLGTSGSWTELNTTTTLPPMRKPGKIPSKKLH